MMNADETQRFTCGIVRGLFISKRELLIKVNLKCAFMEFYEEFNVYKFI